MAFRPAGGDKLQEQKGYATQLAALLAGGPSAFAAVRKDLGEETLAGSLCIVVVDDVAVAERMAKVAADALGCLIMNRAVPGPERSAHDVEALNASLLAHRSYAAQRIIADVEVLAAADIIRLLTAIYVPGTSGSAKTVTLTAAGRPGTSTSRGRAPDVPHGSQTKFVGARLSNVASLVAGLRRFVYN